MPTTAEDLQRAIESETESNAVSKIGGLTVEKAKESVDWINFLVYGNPGVGKTVLAGSADAVPEMSPVLLLNIEGGTLSLRKFYPNVEVVPVKNVKALQDVYDDLLNSNHPYKTVILDSLSEIQKLSMRDIMLEVKRTDPTRDEDVPAQREWGKNLEQTRRLVRAFRDLPMHTIFTAHVRDRQDPKTGLWKSAPSLTGQAQNEVPGFVDIVAYMYMKRVNDDLIRLLSTKQTDTVVAKDRSHSLPDVLQEPTMAAIYQLIMGDN